ncbi:MAG: glycosyltransferase family 9 protein [Candidatus Woesearchaeota archaeon]
MKNPEHYPQYDMSIRRDCRFFLGDMPCKLHKQKGLVCSDCSHFEPKGKRIVIIKLGAIGDIIRTTPLVRKLKEVYPGCEITWVTFVPEVVPSVVDHILKFDANILLRLLAEKYDILYSLDKDKEACALANLIRADVKKGFVLENGSCSPIDPDAVHKYLTGLHDGLNKRNKLSYQQEIFQIVGLPYSHEEYILDIPTLRISLPKLAGNVVGLNTGTSARWPTRNWPKENWVKLANLLLQEGFSAILLGGELEHEKNLAIAKATGAYYHGPVPLDQFVHLVNLCDILVTSVTMALHFAIGLNKKIVLFNNIFNSAEFDLYGRGVVLEPELGCLGCFKSKSDSGCPVPNCMSLINPEKAFDTVKQVLR